MCLRHCLKVFEYLTPIFRGHGIKIEIILERAP